MTKTNIENIVILVVDDDPDLLETLVDLLKVEGFSNTIHAEDGPTAVEIAKNRHIDLIISDLNMPGMDGIETIKKIKSHQPNLISMILTGFGSMDVAIKAFSESKVDDFLSKPIENDELIEKIKLYINKRAANTENNHSSDMVRKDFSANRNYLGQFLVDNGYIEDEDLVLGLEKSKETGQLIGLSLVDLGLITEDELIKAISDYKGYPIALDRDFSNITEECLKSIPVAFANEHKLIAISSDETGVKVAMVNPDDLQITDILKVMTKQPITPLLGTRSKIQKAIDEFYSKYESQVKASSALTDIFNDGELNVQDLADKIDDGEEDGDAAPIRQLVDTIMQKAVLDNGTSDIHIEPEEKSFRVRFRKDGKLYIPSGYDKLPKNIHGSVIARIKIMTGSMQIDIKMKPQDGKIGKKIANREVDFRVASLPTIYGEKIVMRILDKTSNNRSIEEIFSDNQKFISMFRKNIGRKDGMVLVTGPTGSGKTQTLAAAVNAIKGIDINICTAEDPVEITNPGIIQVQINNKQGLTFLEVLKQFLRQDPDVIMIGEMRDYETAHTGCEAALTGHLVFSTLHTNDAPAAVTRFIEMGVKPYLVSTVLCLVIAQRLARTVCKMCKKEHKYDELELKSIGFTDEQLKTAVFYKGEGCPNCKGTGQQGRVALIEMLEVNDKIRHAVTNGATALEIGEIGKQTGVYFSLEEDVHKKMLEGRIDLAEAQKYIMAKEIEEL